MLAYTIPLLERAGNVNTHLNVCANLNDNPTDQFYNPTWICPFHPVHGYNTMHWRMGTFVPNQTLW